MVKVTFNYSMQSENDINKVLFKSVSLGPSKYEKCNLSRQSINSNLPDFLLVMFLSVILWLKKTNTFPVTTVQVNYRRKLLLVAIYHDELSRLFHPLFNGLIT